ncbi:MAG: DUF2318 domain-containing protein [Desulfosarcinaceae bacterium]|nr:DUF2318 domain-containing protein [Desulfosarcinaceae bacterium]
MSKKSAKHRQSANRSNASEKKAIVLGQESGSRNSTYVLLGVAILVLAVVGLVIWGTGPSGGGVTTGVAQTADAAEVRLPVAQFDDGQARHFEYKTGNITVRYFVLKSSDGVVRAAFDACDVCWPAGLGYFQEGDVMICRNCGRRFASIRINEVKGGCNPAPLQRTVDGDQLVIRVADIEGGKGYFNFDQKG